MPTAAGLTIATVELVAPATLPAVALLAPTVNPEEPSKETIAWPLPTSRRR